ncbi:anti-apoptotic protein NR13-like [Arapaima gigas]
MSCWLLKETMEVAEDYFQFCAGSQQSPPSESAVAMRHLAKEMEQQYKSKFQPLVQTFLDSCGLDRSASLRKVMVELVGDGKLNWGRIVSLFAFTGMLVSELCSRGEGTDCCKRLAEVIADYLGVEKREWLLQNEGWEGFCKFSHSAREVNQESAMKTALFAAAGVGIAGITLLFVLLKVLKLKSFLWPSLLDRALELWKKCQVRDFNMEVSPPLRHSDILSWKTSCRRGNTRSWRPGTLQNMLHKKNCAATA